MTALLQKLQIIANTTNYSIVDITRDISDSITHTGYDIIETNNTKPWGSYIRLHSSQADDFINDFFDDLTPEDARRGNPEAELSPKILIVTPKHRLSLQTHARRAERWRFLTPGFYYKGTTLENTSLQKAEAGDVVQFDDGDIHRLCGDKDGFVVVAEIWQHTDPNNLSDEEDIIRLEDDYAR